MKIVARRVRRWYERLAARFWAYWHLYMLQRRLRRIIRRHPPDRCDAILLRVPGAT